MFVKFSRWRQKFQHGGFFGRSFQWRCPFFAIFSISHILQLLSFQYHTFCEKCKNDKTVTEVKPHFVKNVKMT